MMKTDKSKSIGKVGMGAFNTRALSESGVKMHLTLPDGTETDEFLIVQGSDSVGFAAGLAKYNREILRISEDKDLDDETVALLLAERKRELVASIVLSWTFDQDCSVGEIVKFFSASPRIQQQVDLFAGDPTNFFVLPPKK